MPSTTTSPEITDKSLSRMRAHKGNVPSLPQTKYCSLCPAKFTRTTHLNRHLRSHTNERLHRCNLCKTSEFTRSDLLTRHKRTCGQSVNRSRRKSCEACAESKIKCNLQWPCAKCTSRGRECVFRNDPEESRLKSSNRARKTASSSRSMTDDSAPSTPPLSPRMMSSPPPDDFPSHFSSRATSISPSSHILSLPALSESGTSSEVSSSHSSPRSEDFQSFDEQPFGFPFDVGVYEDPLVGSTLSPFDQSLFPSSSSAVMSSALFDGTKPDAVLNDSTSFSLDMNHDHEMDLFASMIRTPDHPPPPPTVPVVNPSTSTSNLLMSQPTITLDYLDPMDMQCLLGASSPTDMYLHLFFTRFLAQIPIIHAPTWKMADTLPLLTRIFHACGALFVKTAEAAAFVKTTLASVMAEIDALFSTVNDPSDSNNVFRHHIHLIIGLVLVQTIIVFQREGSGEPATPEAPHHSLLVSLIRQTGLIQSVASWTAPDWTDPIMLESVWTEWAQFASIKRTLFLAYFHDCSHCMYSASAPSFSSAELLSVYLPCDDALWRAQSATEWFAAAHTPSPYGVGIPRIYGVGMQSALAALARPPGTHSSVGDANANATDVAHLTLPSFALFILIHTVLRNISVAQRSPPPPPPAGGWSCFAADQPSADFTFRNQVLLDNWLQIWLKSPEAASTQDNGTGNSAALKPPFVCNSLPFYWLAQVSLWENSWSGPAFIDVGNFNSTSHSRSIATPHLLQLAT
ncbi:Zinc finger protein klf1 [Mycena venus]|uniref:Zinc finger protein klf1 n=1 Tax=Mycena venus TaxID=2733690 RepID=A0A8H6YTK1_9AGAR|nr:Zinc finger protein klf1 [Mycena venus]